MVGSLIKFLFFFFFNLHLWKECTRYRVLRSGDRSQSYEHKNILGAEPKCDRRLPKAWYRFMGMAGDRMPETCVSSYHCGTHAPGWLRGAHPDVSEGVVSRTVCFTWRNNCCSWRSTILVRNCGDFYVYKLQRAPKCKLRYCGVGVIGRWPHLSNDACTTLLLYQCKQLY